MPAFLLTLLLFGFYFVTYSGYSKTAKQIKIESVIKLLTFKNDLDFTLVEINKVLALVGSTLLCLAILPWFASSSLEIIPIAVSILLVHSSYSTYRYYNSNMIPSVDKLIKIIKTRKAEKQVDMYKAISLVAGASANTLLVLMYFGLPAGLFVACFLGLVHFYFMEIDYRGALGVRPSAYLPFVLGALALVLYFF